MANLQEIVLAIVLFEDAGTRVRVLIQLASVTAQSTTHDSKRAFVVAVGHPV